MQVNTQQEAPTILNMAGQEIAQAQFSAAIERLTPLVRTLDLANPNASAVTALTLMADAQASNGLHQAAYQNYVTATEVNPELKDELSAKILDCLPHLGETIDKPVFAQHVGEYLLDPERDACLIQHHGEHILVNRYDLTNEEAELEFSQLISDHLLIVCLSRFVAKNVALAAMTDDLRREVFRLTVENGIPSALTPMVIALAKHARLQGYSFPVSEDEQVLLLGLKTLMESYLATSDSTAELLEPLLIFLLYQSTEHLPFLAEIPVKVRQSWPAAIQPLLN